MKDWEPRVLQHLTTVVERNGKALGRRNETELHTIARCLDYLLEGCPLQAVDILMARFMSVEMAAVEGDWAVSQHLEIVPASQGGAASDAAKRAAVKEEILHSKLRKAIGGGRVQLRARDDRRVPYRDKFG